MSAAGQQQASVPAWQRRLLPGELGQTAGGRRSARDWAVDVAMFVLAIGIGAGALAETWSQHGEPWGYADIAVGLIAALGLWVRRSHPTALAVATGVASLVFSMAAGPAAIALFNAAIRSSRRALLLLTALAVVTAFAYPLVYPGQDPYLLSLILGLLITGFTIGWGLFVRARRQLVYSLRERAARLEAEQRLGVEQAREAERRRIAREMHDVLAHRVSLLSLHAGALEFRPDAAPEEIAQAAGVIRATAHTALEELREIVGVLRDGGDGDGAVEPPQPTFAQVPALIEEWREAGLRVRWRTDVDDADAVPETIGRTAYRIVQEGLTNARKHAGAAAVEVAIASTDEPALTIEVVSRRPVGVPAAGPAPGQGLPGTGMGLIGLRERVALAGGRLEHGPDELGDFVLRATLPWTR